MTLLARNPLRGSGDIRPNVEPWIGGRHKKPYRCVSEGTAPKMI